MKQIVDKLNKIAKKIDESVEIPQTDLIIDSLDAITKAYGGTPNDSHLIVDKLEDIYNNISSAPSGNIEITENTAEGTTLNIAQFATATVNVAGGGGENVHYCTATIISQQASEDIIINYISEDGAIAQLTSIGIETKVLKLPYYLDGDIAYLDFNISEGTKTVTNMVNCTQSGGEINITDITENSSMTVTVSDWGGVV